MNPSPHTKIRTFEERLPKAAAAAAAGQVTCHREAGKELADEQAQMAKHAEDRQAHTDKQKQTPNPNPSNP